MCIHIPFPPSASPVECSGTQPLPTSCHVSCLHLLSCFSLQYMCGLGLDLFRRLICDLLLRGGWGLNHITPMRIARRVSCFTSCDVHCLGDTGVVWCLSYRGARRQRGFSPELLRTTRSRQNLGRFCGFSKKSKIRLAAAAQSCNFDFTCGCRKSEKNAKDIEKGGKNRN